MILLLPMAIFVYAALKNGAEGDLLAAAFWAGCFVFSVVTLFVQEREVQP